MFEFMAHRVLILSLVHSRVVGSVVAFLEEGLGSDIHLRLGSGMPVVREENVLEVLRRGPCAGRPLVAWLNGWASLVVILVCDCINSECLRSCWLKE